MSTSHIHILAAIGTNAIDIEAACEDLLALRVHHKPNEYGSDEWSEADHIGIFTSKTTHARRMPIKSWLSPLRKSAKSVDAPSSPQLHGQLLAVEAIDEGRGLFFAFAVDVDIQSDVAGIASGFLFRRAEGLVELVAPEWVSSVSR